MPDRARGSTRRRRNPAKRRSTTRSNVDPLELAIERVLEPGDYISYNAAWSFVDDVHAVVNQIEKIIKKEPERAATLFETFIAACHLKAEEIDDSSGSFGMLVDDLFQNWIKARQAAKADPDDTAHLLLTWMEDDPYGFSHDLDRKACKVLNKRGMAAFAEQIRKRFDATLPPDDDAAHVPGYARRRWGGALKTTLAAQRNIDAYIELCEQTELKSEDCLTIATLYKRRRRPEDALSWAERGLEIARADGRYSSSEHELQDMKRQLLCKVGRGDDALASAWAAFEKIPDTYTYKELMRYVPAKQKKAWRNKAIIASEKACLSSQLELWLTLREMARLVERLSSATDEELEDLSHYRTEPLARKLTRPHPDLAARLYRAQAMRIVNAGKSKYYDAALENLAQAKKCYQKADLDADWEALVAEVRERHHRKWGFMPGFEEIVSDIKRTPEPDFLERARKRWPKRGG